MSILKRLSFVLLCFVGTTIAISPPLAAKSVNSVQKCQQDPGVSIDVQLSACISALPSTGGTADATAFHGEFSVATPIKWAKPVRLLLGTVTVTGPHTANIFTMGSDSQIVGFGPGLTVLRTGSGNVPAILATNVHNVSIEHVEIIGNGGVSNQVCVQYQGVIHGSFKYNYVHGCGSGSLGIDTNSPKQFSSDIWITHNSFGPTTFSTVISNVTVGQSEDVHVVDNVVRESFSGQIALDFDSSNKVYVGFNWIYCQPGVNGIQFEATSYESGVVHFTAEANHIRGCTGSQGALTAGVTGGKPITDGVFKNNIIDGGGGINVQNFFGNTNSTIERISIEGNQVHGAAIQIWQHQGGRFAHIRIRRNIVSEFGSSRGGIYIHADPTFSINDVLISRNRVSGGTGTSSGLLLSGTISSTRTYRNDFSGNGSGGEIKDESTPPSRH